MTTDEAREIQSKVMRLAQTFRKRDGQPHLTSSNVDEAYFVMWNNLDTGDDTLADWKRHVIKASMGANNGVTKKGFLHRYAELAMRRDYLPDDEILEEAWGAGDGTFSSIRNRLRKRGYDFLGAEGRTWKVVARPQPEPEPVKMPSIRAILEERGETPMVVSQSTPNGDLPFLQQVEKMPLSIPSDIPTVDWSTPLSSTDSDRLDTIITLLRELLDVWKR